MPTTKKTTQKTSKPAAKKAARKSVAKKAAAKTSRAKKGSKNLVVATNPQSFWVSDGRILNSLVALNDALNEIEKDTYGHHVTSEKNDFADWVEAVLCDEACAADLRKAKTAKGARTVVVKHLTFYQL